jgi:hypothetical protein
MLLQNLAAVRRRQWQQGGQRQSHFDRSHAVVSHESFSPINRLVQLLHGMPFLGQVSPINERSYSRRR